MTVEDNESPTPKKFKTESEEQPNDLLKDEDRSEEESKEIEDDEDDEDEDGLPPSPHSSPPLLDMIDFPPSSTLPPTPPLPSFPRDFDMEEQDSEDDGPPPGWDNKYQLKEEAEQLVTPAAASANFLEIQTEDVRQGAHNEEGEPRSQAHPSSPSELPASDIQVEQHDSEDDGPPPGWDSKCQSEHKLPMACPSTPPSDIKMENAQQDDQNEGQTAGVPSDIKMENAQQDDQNEGQQTARVPSDIQVEQQDSEDDGPPPGWDSKCLSEPKLQMACPSTPPSDIKMENAQQDGQNEGQPGAGVPSDMKVDQEDSEDEGSPPGWDSKCQPESKLQITSTTTPQSAVTDIKLEDLQQEAWNEDGPHPQSQSSHFSPAPELVPSDIKVEEHDLEDDGPPPGWNSKCQPEPNLQMAFPTTSSEKDQEDDEGPPPGWGSRSSPQVQSQVHSSLPSPVVPSGVGCESNNVKIVEESPQPPPRQLSIPPRKPQMSMPKQPPKRNYPEMGQMVCGSCRHLLSYPRGARYVECACCLEENYVLEEHEVGQVICGGCDVLLMYPYGAPKVRCANCSTETEIGDQNRRPPLSEYKRRAKEHLKRVQAG